MNTFHILQKLAALKRNEKASVLQLHQMQERQLRTVLSYAYEHSPYYKAAFEAAGLTAESIQTAPLSAFPTLDKATLLSRFDEIITVPDVTQEELRHFDAEEDADRKPYKESIMWDMFMPQILKLLAKGSRIAYLAAAESRDFWIINSGKLKTIPLKC